LQIDQADHLMTRDLTVHFKSLETLGLSLNNGCTLEKPLTFPGSLRLAVLAPDQPLIVLADISVEKNSW
jgi:hypothetical protein